ncbi:glycine oxidase ThiO, partial [Halalkalibacterium ligniniphilum]
PYSEIGEDPDDFFRFCLASLKAYPQWQQMVKSISGAAFEYTNSGSLHAVYHEADLLALQSRKQWQGAFGAESELLDREQLSKLEPELSRDVVAAMYYPEESHLFAPDYVKALEQGCRKLGVTIVEHLEKVEVIEWQADLFLKAKNGQTFTGDRLVVCSGAWSQELEDTFSIRIPVYPIRGQICAYHIPVGTVKHIVYTSQGYLVPKENGTLVNGASEDIAGFATSVTEKGIKRLTNWNRNVFPFLEKKEPFHRWAGLRPATQDGYPLIGNLQDAPHITFATGHYRNGILLSPITALTVADIVDGKQERVSISLFDPQRFT